MTTKDNGEETEMKEISIHTLIESSQSQHGLSHSDYTQYRTYLTHRISRLRHAKPVKMHQTEFLSDLDSAGISIESNTSGKKQKRHAFKKTPYYQDMIMNISNNKNNNSNNDETEDGNGEPENESPLAHLVSMISDDEDKGGNNKNILACEIAKRHENFLLIELYNAERAYAHYMELKNIDESSGGRFQSSSKSNKNNKSNRSHYVRRLKKAVLFANRLEEMVQYSYSSDDGDNKDDKAKESLDNLPKNTILEAKAYSSWMRGNLHLERKQYLDATKEYAMSHSICQYLGGGSNDNSSSSNVDLTALSSEDDQFYSIEMRDYFSSRAENVIEPMLKFCQFELRDEGMTDDDILEIMRENSIKTNTSSDTTSANTTSSEKGSNNNSTLTPTIHFRNQEISISSQPLRVSLLKLDTLKKTYSKEQAKVTESKKKENALLALFTGYDNAIDIVMKEFKEYASLKPGPAVNAKKWELTNLKSFFQFQKLKLSQARNEERVKSLEKNLRSHHQSTGETGQAKKGREEGVDTTRAEQRKKRLEDITHLYDALLQDARTVASLPGGAVDPSNYNGEADDIVQDDFTLEANAHILRYRALRSFYIGRIYASNQKYNEAKALYDHSLLLANEAAEELSACLLDNNEESASSSDEESGQELVERMIELEKEITGAKCRVEAYVYLESIGKLPSFIKKSSSNNNANSTNNGNNENTVVGDAGKRDLLNRLGDYDAGKEGGPQNKYTVVDPSRLLYIPCKPSFFDIAMNNVGDLKLDEMEALVEKYGIGKSSGGLLGWFRGR